MSQHVNSAIHSLDNQTLPAKIRTFYIVFQILFGNFLKKGLSCNFLKTGKPRSAIASGYPNLAIILALAAHSYLHFSSNFLISADGLTHV